MRLELSLPIQQMNSVRLHMQWLVGPCLVLLLLTMPLWLHSAHNAGALDADIVARSAPTAEMAGSLPADAPSAVHCALHCAPQVLFPALLLCAMLLPLSSSSVPAYARFHARLGSAPPLPPPRTR